MPDYQGNLFADFIRASGAVRAEATSACLEEKLESVLDLCALPPRVGACATDRDVPISLPGTLSVTVRWPTECAGADVIFLVHPGPLSARMRQRMQAGPAHFLRVASVDDIEQAWVSLDASAIAAARARHLIGTLCGLVGEFPELGSLIDALRSDLARMDPVHVERPVIAVVGVDPGLPQERFDVRIGPTPEADAVVASPGVAGWSEAQIESLRMALRHVGAVVTTAPIPGLPEVKVVPEDRLESELGALVGAVAMSALPSASIALWERTACRMAATHSLQYRQLAGGEAVAICIQAGLRPPKVISATFAVDLLVITCVAYGVLSRVVFGVALVGLVAALVAIRAWALWHKRRLHWARQQLDSGVVARWLERQDPRAGWVRDRMAQVIDVAA